jgi:hypothetical protein
MGAKKNGRWNHQGEKNDHLCCRLSDRPRALALFSFESLAAYEQYRTLFGVDREFVQADRIREESGCVIRYERTFMRPLLPEHVGASKAEN